MRYVMFLTILAYSIEKYVSICHPFLVIKYRLSRVSRAIKVVLGIWLIGLLLPVPRCRYQIAQPVVVDNSTRLMCDLATESKDDWVRIFEFTVFFSMLFMILIINVIVCIFLKKSANVTGNNKEQNGKKALKIFCK